MTIPASTIVNVLPGVVSPGGNQLAFNGVILTTNTRVPIGSVLPFPTAAAVGAFFGLASAEYALAQTYFQGFDNASQTPGRLFFSQYAWASPVASYLRGGSLAAMTLVQLQAVTGSLTVTIDGTAKTAASLNLSSAASFSAAATAIGTALGLSGGQTCVFDSISSAFVITSGTTGAGSTITAATGAAAGSLGLSAVASATTSQGAAISTPAAAMNAITAITQNWVAFMTTFEPTLADKLAFAQWTNSQGTRFMYAAWDTDVSAQVANNTTALGPQLAALGYSGTFPISGATVTAAAAGTTLANLLPPVAAFVLGVTASINFNTVNGRITFAEKSQSGLAATCADPTAAANLTANGYNYYGAFATAAQGFTFLFNGQISGKFLFADSYVNEVWLLNNFQLALMSLLTQVNAIAYNSAGYAQVATALSGPIAQAVSFGAIREGVAPSASEAVAVNAAAGAQIDKILASRGWYLQVRDPGATVRAARGTPVINFWFMDGEAIQTITMTSIDVL